MALQRAPNKRLQHYTPTNKIIITATKINEIFFFIKCSGLSVLFGVGSCVAVLCSSLYVSEFGARLSNVCKNPVFGICIDVFRMNRTKNFKANAICTPHIVEARIEK